MRKILVLFDIDGTLIVSGRAGVRGMNRAFAALYGREDALKDVPIAGRTDRAIVIEVLRAIGREPTDAEINRLRQAYVDELEREIVKPVGIPSHVLPGVPALLDALEEARLHSGLLTGNFERGAAVKLTHFSLWHRFQFGAYGDDHVDRRALVPVALARARASGCVVSSASDVIIIGDTPLDVDCARAHGARTIGVTTGPFTADELRAAGADIVVGTLAETGALIGWVKSLNA